MNLEHIDKITDGGLESPLWQGPQETDSHFLQPRPEVHMSFQLLLRFSERPISFHYCVCLFLFAFCLLPARVSFCGLQRSNTSSSSYHESNCQVFLILSSKCLGSIYSLPYPNADAGFCLNACFSWASCHHLRLTPQIHWGQQSWTRSWLPHSCTPGFVLNLLEVLARLDLVLTSLVSRIRSFT